MSIVPPPPILASLAAALLLPLLLAVLSHRPCRIAPPGGRFLLAALAVAAAWTGCLPFAEDTADLLAGALLLVAAVLAEFTIWTLLAWGFTVSLLLALARQGQAVDLDDWIESYTDGQTAESFSHDRLAVLLRFGLATRTNDRLVRTPIAGRWTTCAVRLLRSVFGLPS
jgi:hypothetical protein